MKHFAFALACGMVLSLVSCTGGGSSSPSGAVTGFMEASKAGNKDGAMKYVQTKDRELLQKMEAKQGASKESMVPPNFTYKITGEKVTGDTAVVTVTGNHDGKEQTQELKLVKEDGAWKIDLIPDEMHKIMEGMGGAAGVEAMKTMGEKMQKEMGEKMQKAIEDAAKEAEGEEEK
jgi:hypothetical protein